MGFGFPVQLAETACAGGSLDTKIFVNSWEREKMVLHLIIESDCLVGLECVVDLVFWYCWGFDEISPVL